MRATARWWARLTAIAAIAALTAGCAQGVSSPVDDPLGPDAVRIGAFRTTMPAWNTTLDDFAGQPGWPGGQAVYGAFGTIEEVLQHGEDVDLLHISDSWNMSELVRDDFVPADWNNGRTGGVPVVSIVTMVVRAGNPRDVHDWADLMQPGLEVVTPNPATEGSGRTALLAAYAAGSNGGADPEAGRNYVRRLILEHIALGPTSVWEAREKFLEGRGDVLLLSEAAARTLERDGYAVETVVPRQTLRMDFPVALTYTGLQKPTARALVAYMYSARGQQVWADNGFRPTTGVAGLADPRFPEPDRVWTVEDLGGWDVVGPRFFHPENGIYSKLFRTATGS